MNLRSRTSAQSESWTSTSLQPLASSFVRRCCVFRVPRSNQLCPYCSDSHAGVFVLHIRTPQWTVQRVNLYVVELNKIGNITRHSTFHSPYQATNLFAFMPIRTEYAVRASETGSRACDGSLSRCYNKSETPLAQSSVVLLRPDNYCTTSNIRLILLLRNITYFCSSDSDSVFGVSYLLSICVRDLRHQRPPRRHISRLDPD